MCEYFTTLSLWELNRHIVTMWLSVDHKAGAYDPFNPFRNEKKHKSVAPNMPPTAHRICDIVYCLKTSSVVAHDPLGSTESMNANYPKNKSLQNSLTTFVASFISLVPSYTVFALLIDGGQEIASSMLVPIIWWKFARLHILVAGESIKSIHFIDTVCYDQLLSFSSVYWVSVVCIGACLTQQPYHVKWQPAVSMTKTNCLYSSI